MTENKDTTRHFQHHKKNKSVNIQIAKKQKYVCSILWQLLLYTQPKLRLTKTALLTC